MQVTHLEPLLGSVPEIFHSLIQTLADMNSQSPTEHDSEFYDIKETATKLKKSFALYQKDVYSKCKDASFFLGSNKREFNVFVEEKQLNPTALNEIQNNAEQLKILVDDCQNKCKEMGERSEDCQANVENKINNILEAISSGDFQTVIDALYFGSTATFVLLKAYSSTLTVAKITEVSLLAGGGILAVFVFVSFSLFHLFKYVKNSNSYQMSNELKGIMKSLAKLFKTARKLEEMFADTIEALDDYLRKGDEAIRLSPDTFGARAAAIARDLISQTEKVEKMFSKIMRQSKKDSKKYLGH